MSAIHAELTVLSSAEVESIHRGSLRVLETTGVRIPHPHCLQVCRELGGKVDFESHVVRFPARVSEEILARIRFRADEPAAGAGPHKLEGRISTGVHLVDYRTNTRRLGLLDDIRKGIALVEHLKNIPTANAVVVPSDVPAGLSDVVSFQSIYSFSRKPGGTYVLSPHSARYVLEMARVMGRQEAYLLDTVSPLQFRKENLEIAVLFAQAGQPVSIGPMSMGGATAPVTLAGGLLLQNAEVLASLFLVLGLTGRLPAYTSTPHSMDMRTMLCSFGSPNQALFGVAVAQLARHYGLAAESNAGLSDALWPDFQAGFEKASTALFAGLAGARAIGAQGIAGSDQGFSFEQLAIDNEWLEAYNYMLEGFDVTEETLAEDLIAAVGIGGGYFAEKHTAAHLRPSYFHSKLFNRDDWATWLKKGAKGTLDRAAEFVEAVTAGYRDREPVCSPAQFSALEEIARESGDSLPVS
jgi:trimethylamine--corrinoid protein Co-methyltransferase